MARSIENRRRGIRLIIIGSVLVVASFLVLLLTIPARELGSPTQPSPTTPPTSSAALPTLSTGLPTNPPPEATPPAGRPANPTESPTQTVDYIGIAAVVSSAGGFFAGVISAVTGLILALKKPGKASEPRGAGEAE